MNNMGQPKLMQTNVPVYSILHTCVKSLIRKFTSVPVQLLKPRNFELRLFEILANSNSNFGHSGFREHDLFMNNTDGQKKRYSKRLSCIAYGPQTRAAQAYNYQNLESSLRVISICRFCLAGMLANIHVFMF